MRPKPKDIGHVQRLINNSFDEEFGRLIVGITGENATGALQLPNIVDHTHPTNGPLTGLATFLINPEEIGGGVQYDDEDTLPTVITGTVAIGVDDLSSTFETLHLRGDNLKVSLENSQVPIGGGVEYEDEDAIPTVITGKAVLGVDDLSSTFETLHLRGDNLKISIENTEIPIGGGTEYTEGDIDASITGSAILWEDAADTLRPVNISKPLPTQLRSSTGVAADINASGRLGILVYSGNNNSINSATFATSPIPDTVHGLSTLAGIYGHDDASANEVYIKAKSNALYSHVASEGLGLMKTAGTDTYAEASTKGSLLLGVRKDAAGTLVNTDNELAPLQFNSSGQLRVESTASTVNLNSEYEEGTNRDTTPPLDQGILIYALRQDTFVNKVGNEQYGPLTTDDEGNLKVSGVISSSKIDDSGFIYGTTEIMPIGGIWDDTPTNISVTERVGVLRISRERVLLNQPYDSALARYFNVAFDNTTKLGHGTPGSRSFHTAANVLFGRNVNPQESDDQIKNFTGQYGENALNTYTDIKSWFGQHVSDLPHKALFASTTEIVLHGDYAFGGTTTRDSPKIDVRRFRTLIFDYDLLFTGVAGAQVFKWEFFVTDSGKVRLSRVEWGPYPRIEHEDTETTTRIYRSIRLDVSGMQYLMIRGTASGLAVGDKFNVSAAQAYAGN